MVSVSSPGACCGNERRLKNAPELPASEKYCFHYLTGMLDAIPCLVNNYAIDI